MKHITLLCLLLFLLGCTCQQKAPFRKIWKKHISKTYNWIFADNEAAKYKKQEQEARAYLHQLRQEQDVYAISARLILEGFHWRKEVVDFTSYPWVTIARKRGDCDDFMVLWEAILKSSNGYTERLSVSSTDGRGHAMLLYFCKEKVYLLSNLVVLGRGKKEEIPTLIRRHYGSKTACWIRY